jgi:hypothetical protein
MKTTITSIKNWMSIATADEREQLAAMVGTTAGNLYQLSGGHRQASAQMAGVIEAATAKMHKSSKGRLPKIYRTDLCMACQHCNYAQKCLGATAVISEFPIANPKQMDLPL